MKSNLMKNAHKLAKTFTGDYQACLKLAMIILWKKVKEGKDLNKVVNAMTRTKKATKKAPVKKEKSVDDIRKEMFRNFPSLADDNEVETIGHIIFRVEDAVNIAYEDGCDSYDKEEIKEWKKEVKQAEKFLKKYSQYAKLEPYV